MRTFFHIFQWDDQKSWDWIPSQKYLKTLENQSCSVLDAKMDHTELWRTSPVQTLLKPGRSLPSLADSEQHTMFKLNRVTMYGYTHTSLTWPTMPWWKNGEKKYGRLSDLENGPLNHIFSVQRRFLLVLSQKKLTAVNTDDKLSQLLQFSHCSGKRIRPKCRKLIHPETQRWG